MGRAKSHGGAPALHSLYGEPAPSPDTSVQGGFKGSPTIKERRGVQTGPTGEVYPHAYGGAPTAFRRPDPKSAKGGGANVGGGSTSTGPGGDVV